MASGYTHCACRDCFDIAMSSDMTVWELCSECREAGCEPFRTGSPDYEALPAYMTECHARPTR